MNREDSNNARHKKPSRKNKKSIGVMDTILIIVGISLLVFTLTMIKLFRECGAVPDTLVTCVFATLGGECGIMGWIKTNKDRHRERTWEKEDKQEERDAEQKEAETLQSDI